MTVDFDYLKKVWGWDQDSPVLFDRQCGQTEGSFYAHGETLLSLLDPHVHEVGLNVGCGCGRIEAQWAHRARELHGVDFAAAAIEIARRNVKHANVTFHHNDGQSLPMFADATFDFAWCEQVFQHVPREVTFAYVKEIHRVLKPGGRFTCHIPRVEKYNNEAICGGMSEEMAAEMLSVFSSVTYPDYEKRDWYIVPVAVK